MRINKQIRAPKVRLISPSGEQIGVVTFQEALQKAIEYELDLVEISPNTSPPVCKIIDYGKFRYNQTKREKESKKSQHQIKIKEIKLKPNIDAHDMQTKQRHARDFLVKGYKVKITCMFRGREMAHPEVGKRAVQQMIDNLEDVAAPEAPMKMFGRFLTIVLAPVTQKKMALRGNR